MGQSTVGRPGTRRRLRDAPKYGVGYTRYSTDKQGSTTEQLATNEELALEDDVTLLKQFSDEGLSRTINDRPGLMDMFAFIEAHPEVGYIIVNELERLTYGISQRAEVTKICKRLGITIIEDVGSIDPHDEEAMHKADERAITSQGEVLKIRRRVRRNLKVKVKNGTIVMRPPYGTRMKPLVMPDGTVLPSGVSMLDNATGKKITSGKLEVHPDEIEWLRKIFHWADEGATMYEICRRLEANGVPTKTGRTKWDRTTVRGILDNPFYKGDMAWGARETLRDEEGRPFKVMREDDDPARLDMKSPLGELIPVDQWNRIQDRKAANVRRRRISTNQVFDHRVYCERCGHKMYARSNKTQKGLSWRYVCLSSYGMTNHGPRDTTSESYGEPCKTGHSIALKDIVSAITGETNPHHRGETVEVTVVRGAIESAAHRRKKAEADLKSVKDEKGRLLTLFLKGKITEEQHDEMDADVDLRIAEAEAEVGRLNNGVGTPVPITGAFRSELAGLAAALTDESRPVELRQTLLDRAGLDRIYVDKPVLRLHFRE